MSRDLRDTTSSRATSQTELIRLDLLANANGPVEQVVDAMTRFADWNGSTNDLTRTLRERLAIRAGVDASWITLANGIDELHAMIAQWRSPSGPMVLFPPSDTGLDRWVQRHSAQVERFARGKDFSIPVRPDTSILPRGATSVVMSPNDPTGTIMSPQEAVRLSRQSALLVIDERHAAYSPRTLMPLVREFENIALLQTFETFAALTAFPLAWVVAPPPIARAIASQERPSGPARSSVVAALAALDAEDEITRSVRQITVEKGRLFRQLRKLSMISPPYPTWSNFLLARIERGTSEFFVPRLAERGIIVHSVEHPRLANHLRISAVSLDATYALKQALIDIALDLP